MKLQKKELILIAVILVIAAGGFFINAMIHRKPAIIAEVSIDSDVIATYDLSQDVDTVIHGYNGGTNHLIIQDGMLWIEEASCPDKVCIYQGKISMNGEMVVCLRNHMIVSITEPD